MERPDEVPTIPRRDRARRSRWRKTASRLLQYYLLRLVVAVVSRLPLAFGRWLARRIGGIVFPLLRRERAIALANLSAAYGEEMSPGEIRALAKASFVNTVLTLVEWVILRRWSRSKLERVFPETIAQIDDYRRDCVSLGTGTVGITAHLGNWEMLNLLVGIFAPGLLVSIAKPPKLPRTRAFLHRLRTVEGNDVIYTDESVRKLLAAIRNGRLLGFLPDQDVRTNRGIFVDFFGRPAHTVTLPVALARKQGVRMNACALVREGSSFRFLTSRCYEIQRTDDEDHDLLEGTRRWTAHIEGFIRAYPGQWLWYYPRWRTEPSKPRTHIRPREASPKS